jgi:hypothetical protein
MLSALGISAAAVGALHEEAHRPPGDPPPHPAHIVTIARVVYAVVRRFFRKDFEANLTFSGHLEIERGGPRWRK